MVENNNREVTFWMAIGVITRNKPFSHTGEFHEYEERISFQWRSGIPVYCERLEDIHAAMISLGIEAYEVFEKDGDKISSEALLYRSPIVIEYVENKKAQRARNVKEADERLVAFNELPLLIQEWMCGKLTIKLTRTKGEFNLKMTGHRIRSDVDFQVYENDVLLETVRYGFSDYISSDEKVLAKKFRQWNTRGVFKDSIEETVPLLKEMYQARKKFRDKWRM